LGLDPLPSAEPADIQLLQLALVAPDTLQVTGATEGAEIQLFVGDALEGCSRLASGSCRWVQGTTATATVVGGVATLAIDPLAILAVQAYDPTTGATSGVVRRGGTGDDASPTLTGIVPEGTYTGFSGFDVTVWVDVGDVLTVTGTIDEDDSGLSVRPVGEMDVLDEDDMYASAVSFVGIATEAGWVEVSLAVFCFCNANADLAIDIAPTLRTWYADADGDGHGDPLLPVDALWRPAGTAGDDADCDDGDAAFSPTAGEVCGDGIDTDCDGFDAPCGIVGDELLEDARPRVSGARWVVPVGDLDGDGSEDLALVRSEGVVFAAAGRADLCAAPLNDEQLALPWLRTIGDDDGDGVASLVFEGQGGVWLVEGIPAGPVEDVGLWVPGVFDVQGRAFADLTGDGLVELVLNPAVNETDTFSAYEAPYAEGDAPFATWLETTDTLAELGDLDGDGLGEVGLSADGEIWIGFGPHGGTTTIWDVASPVWSSSDPFGWLYESEDVDGDGRFDLLAGAGEESLHLLVDVTPAGSVDLATIRIGQAYANDPDAIVVADVAVVGGDLWLTGPGLHQLVGPLVGTFDRDDLVRRDGALASEQLWARDLDGDGAEDLLVYGSDAMGGTARLLFGSL
ncbi:MAG: hypothetical protein H0V89_13420, partial [Deltaproteobacteria bacterium]|nr:hypothetical protein [Deltaproteobacteria bacterium]